MQLAALLFVLKPDCMLIPTEIPNKPVVLLPAYEERTLNVRLLSHRRNKMRHKRIFKFVR